MANPLPEIILRTYVINECPLWRKWHHVFWILAREMLSQASFEGIHLIRLFVYQLSHNKKYCRAEENHVPAMSFFIGTAVMSYLIH